MRNRRAVSIVEIVLAMTIVAMLTSVIVVSYSGQAAEAAFTVNRDRMAAIRTVIDAWQLERKRPWFQADVPPGSPLDPWEQPYRVDPVQGVIWSRGPDGKLKSPPKGGDMVMAYTPMSLKPAGRPVARATSTIGGIEITWSWPGYDQAAVDYRIHRTTSPASGFQLVGTAPPTSPLRYLDLGAAVGVVHYYQVEGVLGPGDGGGGPRPNPRSLPASARRIVDGPPHLELLSASAGVHAGTAAIFRLKGQGNGSPLASLTFQGAPQPIGGTSFQLDVPHVFPNPGTETVQATLVDTKGRATTKTLDISVQ